MSTHALRRTAEATRRTLLSAPQYARACHVSVRTVRRWIADGRVTTIRESPRRLRLVFETMPLKRWKALHRETIVACLLEQPAIEPLPSYWELAALAVAPGRQPAGELECVTSVGQAVWRLLAHWNQPPRVGDWISVRDLAALCGKRQGVIRNALRRGDLQGFRRRPLSAALGVHWAQAIWYADDATATKVIMTQIVNRYYGWSSEATQQQISDALIAAITPRLAAPAPRW